MSICEYILQSEGQIEPSLYLRKQLPVHRRFSLALKSTSVWLPRALAAGTGQDLPVS